MAVVHCKLFYECLLNAGLYRKVAYGYTDIKKLWDVSSSAYCMSSVLHGSPSVLSET